ncbi:MAG: thioredoxin [Candidatus Methanomethylophilaceae archaeon]|nr:thioredoxin [Candidatus Methanomethylophilaceae archaeon]
MVTEVTESTFDNFVSSNKVAVVDCWAPWCGPCRRMGPIIDEIAEELAGKVAVGKLNTDENQGIAMKYNINAIPTILIFKDGKLVDSPVGLRPKEDLIEIITSV